MPTDDGEGRAGEDKEPRPQKAEGAGDEEEERPKHQHHHKKKQRKSLRGDAKPARDDKSASSSRSLRTSTSMTDSGNKLPPPLPKPIVVSCAPATPTGAPKAATPVSPRQPGADARSPQRVALGTQLGADARICTYQNRTMTVSQFLHEARKSTKTHVVGASPPMYDLRALHQRQLHRARSTPTFKSWEMMCRQKNNAGGAGGSGSRGATLIHNAVPVPSSLPQSPVSGPCDIGLGPGSPTTSNKEQEEDEEEEDMEIGKLQRSAVSVLVRRPHMPVVAGSNVGSGAARDGASYSGSLLPRRALLQQKLRGKGCVDDEGYEDGEDEDEERYARLGRNVRFGSQHRRDNGSRNLLSAQRFGREMAAGALFRQMFQVFESAEQEREFVSTIVLTHTFIMPSAVFVEKLVSAYKNPALVRISSNFSTNGSNGSNNSGNASSSSPSTSSSSSSSGTKTEGTTTSTASQQQGTMQLTSVNDIRVRVLRCLLLWARLVDEFAVDESAVSAVAAFMCDYARGDLPTFTEECARRLLRLLMPMFLEKESSLSTAPDAVLELNFMLSPKYAPLEWTLPAETLLPLQKRQVRRQLVHSNTVKKGLSTEATTCEFIHKSAQSTERARMTLQDSEPHSGSSSSSSSSSSINGTTAATDAPGVSPGAGKRLKTLIRRASTAFFNQFSQKSSSSSSSSSHDNTSSGALTTSANASMTSPRKRSPSDAPSLTQSNPSVRGSAGALSPPPPVPSSPSPTAAAGTSSTAPVEVKANLNTSEPVYSAAERRRLMEVTLNRVDSDESQFTAQHLLLFWQMSEVSHTPAPGAFCSFAARRGVEAAVRECGVSAAQVARLADVLLARHELVGPAPFDPAADAEYHFARAPAPVAEHVPGFPDVLPSTAAAGALLFAGIAPRELARQLTLLEHRLFRAIRLCELTDVAWQDEQHRTARAPNVVAFTEFSDTVSTWVATEVVLASDLRLRAAVLAHMVDLADECLRLQNYNGLLEIMLGLMNASVSRLRQTWAAVPPDTAARFARLKKIAWPFPNYAGYRPVLQQAVAPMIPALSVILIDLVFIDECSRTRKTPGRSSGSAANSSASSAAASGASAAATTPETAQDVVDLQRLRLHAAIFQSILNVKGSFYTLKHNHAVQDFLHNLTIVPASSLIEYSRLCEPDQPTHVPTNVQNGAHTLV